MERFVRKDNVENMESEGWSIAAEQDFSKLGNESTAAIAQAERNGDLILMENDEYEDVEEEQEVEVESEDAPNKKKIVKVKKIVQKKKTVKRK